MDIFPFGSYIGHLKGEVGKAGFIKRLRIIRACGFVLKNLDGRSVLTMARQAEMMAADTHSGFAGEGIDMRAVMVTLCTADHATHDLLVEVRQFAPVAGDEIRVGVADAVRGVHGAC